jgi:hypothetical protein
VTGPVPRSDPPAFLRINGYVLDLTDDEAFALTMSVAAGQLDADGIGKQLRLASTPVTRPVPAFLRSSAESSDADNRFR